MKFSTTFFNRSLLLVLSSFILYFSCGSPTDSKLEIQNQLYKPTQQEALDQSLSVLDETLEQSSLILLGYYTNKANLGKTSGGLDYYYIDGWHTWRGELDESPFDIEDSYNAEYLGKLQFQDSDDTVLDMPNGATKLLWDYKAHAAFGFVDSEPYGDEVWYDVEGFASPLSANPTDITVTGEYERRWVGDYNGVDTELTYKVILDAQTFEFYYNSDMDDFVLNGVVNVNVDVYDVVVTFENSRTSMVEVYEDGVLKESFNRTLPNFYEIYNLPSLENLQMGVEFNFPIPIPL